MGGKKNMKKILYSTLCAAGVLALTTSCSDYLETDSPSKTDAAFVFKTLEERFPDIDFMRCWMDPVMQKTGLTPEQKLKEAYSGPSVLCPPTHT
jgi:hypothetical protein